MAFQDFATDVKTFNDFSRALDRERKKNSMNVIKI